MREKECVWYDSLGKPRVMGDKRKKIEHIKIDTCYDSEETKRGVSQ